jgi:hypothetical protein
MSDTLAGETLTEATGGGGVAVTVTWAVACFPPDFAVIVVLPIEAAVTNPPGVTVAAAVLDDHETDWPVNSAPDESCMVATNCSV